MQQRIHDFLDGAGEGIITTADLRSLGCGPQVLRTLERQGVLVRVARGAYVAAARLDPPPTGDDDDRKAARSARAQRAHLLRLDAILRSYGAKVAASHESAALAWGLPLLPSGLERVHVVHTSAGRTSRRHDAFTIHRCEHEGALTRHAGRRLVVPAVAAIGTALTSGLVAGVVAMDGALHARLTTRDQLTQHMEQMRHTPGLSTARHALELADGLAESAGETRLRILLTRLGIRFVAQHWVRTHAGQYYRVDFYLPELGVVLEFDGAVKYAGARGRAALTAEKAREDDLRRDGLGMARVTWDRLTPAQVRAVVTAASEQARPEARRRPADPPPWAAGGVTSRHD